MRQDGLGLAGITGQRFLTVKGVLRTVDGGLTWAPWINPAGLPESGFDAITCDRDQVWVRMTGGTWLVSQDLGSSWLAVPALTPSLSLSPVVAPLSSEFGNLRLAAQPRRALVMRESAGRSEGYYVSANQGQTWARLPGPGASDAIGIRQLWFFDRLRGMAIGDGNGAYGVAYDTEDGGFSWARRSPESEQPDINAVFATPSLGFRLTASGVLLRSTDGGRQWSTPPQSGLPQFPTWAGAKLLFIDANHGWIQEYQAAFQGNNRLWRTLDGGLTWQVATQFNFLYPNTMPRLVDANHGWFTGPADTLLATMDGGQSWNLQATGLVGAFPTLLFALDAQTAWLTNGTGWVASATGGR